MFTKMRLILKGMALGNSVMLKNVQENATHLEWYGFRELGDA
jgi:hypothetical protein